jgi:hypothetical protein
MQCKACKDVNDEPPSNVNSVSKQKLQEREEKTKRHKKRRHNQTFDVDQNNHRNTLIRFPRFLSFLLLP